MVKRKERQPEAGLAAAGTPRILAIDDVHLSAASTAAEAMTRFYTEFITLDPLPAESAENRLAFYGYPRSGPRLFVTLLEAPPPPLQKRQLVVQVASLFDLEPVLVERAVPYEWSRGWSYSDRRLCVLDPAENRVELVAYHFL